MSAPRENTLSPTSPHTPVPAPGADAAAGSAGARRGTSRLWPGLIAAAVVATGGAAAVYYASLDLALSHWDARAHLVVARRVFDSLTPGWQQIGAVWLPLPHVLNMIPVQVDAWYRSGASGTALSVLSLAAGTASLAAMLLRVTGSITAAVLAPLLLLANPSVLYLQSTPMTEPMLFGTTLVAVALTARWTDTGGGNTRAPGLALAAACMTRYEAWPIAAVLIVLAWGLLMWRGASPARAARAGLRLAAWPIAAIVLFALNSRWTTGTWFVGSGFFVPENEALGNPWLAWTQVREGLQRLSGRATVWPAYAATVAIVWTSVRARTSLALVLALLAAAVLPWFAYVQGHPFRIRYSLPLVVACIVIVSAGVAVLPRRLQAFAAAALLAGSLMQATPLDRAAPMIVEAMRDARNFEARSAITRYLTKHYDGSQILMSMGSLAHYMHDLSRAGFDLRTFLHEGNGELWIYTLELGPRGHVGWVIIDERGEGGDILFHRTRENPDFLDGFERVAEGGGVVLYRGSGFRVQSSGFKVQGSRFKVQGSKVQFQGS